MRSPEWTASDPDRGHYHAGRALPHRQMRRKLPLGIQTFREIREDGCYYVDKTLYAKRLVGEGKHYLLSRPRRFGKSLFLDTLKELFEGNEPLFRGLAIHDGWDWSVRHPVIRLDFGGGNYREPGFLRARIGEQLAAAERRTGASSRNETAGGRLASLLETLHADSGQRAVVLVDEYDKPILDALDDPEQARTNRDFLRGFYGTVKSADAHVRFSFFTGVSKFTRVSLFSDLNNLTDITLHSRYGNICGYTESDLDEVFAPELEGLDRARIRDWYNGYSWRGPERVYNPYGILLLFDTRAFQPHWFGTATPRFLIDVLRRRGVLSPDLAGMTGTNELLSAFDVDEMEPEALLFQTGYLTIVGEEDSEEGSVYRLGYPNREVRQGLNNNLLRAMTPARVGTPGSRLRGMLRENDFRGLEGFFRAFFDAIPYEWHTKNEIARYEGYYAAVCYSHLVAAGLDVVVEESSSRGRADLAVRFAGQVFLFEIKAVEREPTGTALAQLRERDYAAKYRSSGEPIHLIGIEFSRATRNVAAFEAAAA